MKLGYSKKQLPFFYGVGFLLFLILTEFSAIMVLNNGVFVYTLDDPYIHMALAENIAKGHYGINYNEFSSPSSSILWPFILAPFSLCEFFPLSLNIISAILTVYVFYKILNLALRISDERIKVVVGSSFLILFVLATNMVGLIFTGMEHSLQVLSVSLIGYGLIVEAEENRMAPWLLAAIVLAPLIRYENLAISIAALAYLMMRRYFKQALVAGVLLLVFVCGFSLFLISLGLDFLPTSIIAKSDVIASGGKLSPVLSNLKKALGNPHGLFLLFGTIGLLSYLMFVHGKKRQLAIATVFAVSMHLIAGRYGWYNRYEIYIWSFFLSIALYFVGPKIKNALDGMKRKNSLAKVIILAIGFVVISAQQYIYDIFTLPIAANNIYEQQYQMHRFAADYLNKPVAINDLGYVSYKNDNYVLDLWGMTSEKALNYRMMSGNGVWMNELCQKNNVELAMIYEKQFKGIPAGWIKIGELHLGKKRITPAYKDVAFYAISQKAYSDIVKGLSAFINTLPSDVKFTLQRE